MPENVPVFDSAVVCILGVLLVAAIVTDLKDHRIPNRLLAPALSLALLLHTMNDGGNGLLVATGGLAMGLFMFLPLYVIGGMAAGDVKLLAVVGSFLGPWGAILAGMATMVVGAAFGIIALIWRHVRPSLEVRAARLTDTLSDDWPPTLTGSPRRQPEKDVKLAYAPAIAVGTLAAMSYMGYLSDNLIAFLS